MVFTDEKGFKSVDYSPRTPFLVEPIKELNDKNQTQLMINEAQQKTIESLQTANKTSELKIFKLETFMENLMQSTIKEEAKK